jgi:hypothetical protein
VKQEPGAWKHREVVFRFRVSRWKPSVGVFHVEQPGPATGGGGGSWAESSGP